MLEFDDESKRIVSTFMTYRNDIDIYTEDNEKDREFYKELFRKLLDKNIKINDVTPLGSKNNVIERCKKESENGRKKIFIIDGDVSIIHGENLPSLKNLHVLEAYCIENFLIDENAIVEFIFIECGGTKSREELRRDISFETWLNTYTIKFIDLFIHFAIANLSGCSYTLCSAFKFVRKEGDEITFDESFIDKEIERNRINIVDKIGQGEYDKKLNELREKWTYNMNNLLTIVSGKDYLIPVLLLKTMCFQKSRPPHNLARTKMLLIQYSNLERLGRLKHTIEAL